MANKLTTLLASAILVAGFATTAFAQGTAPAAPHPQNPSPMQGQSMMSGLGTVTSGPEMMNGQNARGGQQIMNGQGLATNGRRMMNGSGAPNGEDAMGGNMMGMMQMMTEMNRMMDNCNRMMESAMRSPPAQPRHA